VSCSIRWHLNPSATTYAKNKALKLLFLFSKMANEHSFFHIVGKSAVAIDLKILLTNLEYIYSPAGKHLPAPDPMQFQPFRQLSDTPIVAQRGGDCARRQRSMPPAVAGASG
jgi:hypothetical protein